MHIHIHAATASFRSGTLREAAFPFCCRRQLFFLAAGGNFSLVLQEAAFLLCCRRQLFSCAAGGSFSLVLQEAAFLSCCRRQLFRFFLQEAAFLLCCRRQLSLSRCRRQLSLSRCRKQLFFPFGAVGCCNVSCSFLCAVCVTGLAPCGVFSFCHARCCDVRSSQLKLN